MAASSKKDNDLDNKMDKSAILLQQWHEVQFEHEVVEDQISSGHTQIFAS